MNDAELDNNPNSMEQVVKSNESELDEIIAQLTKEKETLVSEGRYLEAEQIRLKICEIKSDVKGSQKRDMNLQHEQEAQALEESYNKEMFDLNSQWEQKFNQFELQAKTLEGNINEKHTKEMEEYIVHLDNKISKVVKFSREYLQLKQSEMLLAKQEKYIDAHFLKTKCDAMEKNETEKFIRERNEKIRVKLEALNHKQMLEKNALKQKLDTEFEIMQKMKEEELNALTLKYKNKRTDLEKQHKMEQNLSENSNLMRQKNTAEKISTSMRSYMSAKKQHSTHSSYSPVKFNFTSESKIRQMSKSLRKNKDEETRKSNYDNDHYQGTENKQHETNTNFIEVEDQAPVEIQNTSINLIKDSGHNDNRASYTNGEGKINFNLEEGLDREEQEGELNYHNSSENFTEQDH